MKPSIYAVPVSLTDILYAAMLVLVLSSVQAASPGKQIWERITQPLYPRIAVSKGVEGELLVEYSLDDGGKVVAPRVVRANPAGIFDESVLQEVQFWRYKKEPSIAGPIEEGPLRISFVFQIAPCAAPRNLGIDGPRTGLDRGTLAADTLESIRICVGGTGSKGRQLIKSSVEADEFFMKGQLLEQASRPEYVEALGRLEADRKMIRSERVVPHDVTRNVDRRTPLPIPVVPPGFRRALTPGSAVVHFDVDGSGRVMNISSPNSGAGFALARDFAQTVALWLFSPHIEGDVGIKRVGLTARLIVEFKEAGKISCGQLKSEVPADIEEKICLDLF